MAEWLPVLPCWFNDRNRFHRFVRKAVLRWCKEALVSQHGAHMPQITVPMSSRPSIQRKRERERETDLSWLAGGLSLRSRELKPLHLQESSLPDCGGLTWNQSPAVVVGDEVSRSSNQSPILLTYMVWGFKGRVEQEPNCVQPHRVAS